MLQLFSAEGCPYAQRVRALAAHLSIPFELREIDLRNKPAEFLALSPTGRVPLLVDGELKLYESFVLLQYLAEKHGFAQALAADPGLRARQRLAMIQFDSIITPAHMQSLKERSYAPKEAVERELDELGRTLEASGSGPNLLSFHLAPFWARMQWIREHAPFVATVEKRPALRAWLDRAVALPAVQATLPDREATVRLYLTRYGPTTAA